MASPNSESSEVRSTTGSVLITRNPESIKDAPTRCFPLASFEATTGAPSEDVDENKDEDRVDSELPSAGHSHKQDPDGWVRWATVDPALVGFTLDEADYSDLRILGNRPHSQTPIEWDSTLHEGVAAQPPHNPFHKWMKTLRRRARHRRCTITTDEPLATGPSLDDLRRQSRRISQHRQSSSSSSFGFVEAVKTASVSLASGSIFARSRRNSMRSSRTKTHTDRSSRASISSNRCSEDSAGLDKPQVLDKAAVERSLQRRRILEELISTEEGYIGDVRFLMNVYVTILVSLPTMPQGLRSSINRNLADIVELHEELLGELHRAVPHSEYTQLGLPPRSRHQCQEHRRIRSLDAVPEDDESRTWLGTVPGMVAEPNVAADVAKLFTKKMNRFFLYEEYGAKYEMMIKDIASAHRIMPQWDTYQRGLETLASSIGPRSKHGDKSKKSLTIGDLLVKPIQRVCKYPLLFAELLKYTPVADSPYAHMEIENSLVRLREATSQINRATDDARVKTLLEKTWLLQDRLVFPDSKLDAASKNRIRSFGHIQLCGVLYACWQAKEGVQGQYMVILLYKEWLCLASASRVDQIYTLQACIPLSHIKVETADNGRGLQCHTAPFSWKIVFECDYQLYEMMLAACTPKEEDEWRSRLELALAMQSQKEGSAELYSSLFLSIKSLGTVFGKQGTIARKISIHRATTVSPKSPLCNVIVRNTSLEKESLSSSVAAPINRSPSLLTTKSRIPVLAPSRGDRARLEALLSDVWTREILPFPGMTARARNEHLIRTSAHSMMRKLSVTSIASTFTKRSASLASITRGDSDEESDGEDSSSMMPTTPTGEDVTPDVDIYLDDGGERHKITSCLSDIVDDESEREATPTIRDRSMVQSHAGSLEEKQRLRPRMCVTKSPSAWQLREMATLCPSPSTNEALRTRSANGPQLKRRASLLSRRSVRSTCSTAERIGSSNSRKKRPAVNETPTSTPRSTSPKKLSPSSTNRWSKVDMLRRGGMAQGIRGFFR